MDEIAELVERGLSEAATLESGIGGTIPLCTPVTLRDLATALQSQSAELVRVRHDNEMLTKGGIIEVAVRNPSVSDYMNHWEGRAEAAEAELTRVREALTEIATSDLVSDSWVQELARLALTPTDPLRSGAAARKDAGTVAPDRSRKPGETL